MNLTPTPNLGLPAAKKPLDQNTYGAFTTGLDQTGQMWDAGAASMNQGDQFAQQAGGTYGTMAGADPGSLATTDYTKYTNPYVTGVVDPTMAELNRQEAMQKQQLEGASQAAGAFGGDRMQIQKAAMNRDFDVTRKNAIAELYKSGFDNAQKGAMFDINNATGREAAGAAGLAGLGGNYMNQGNNFMTNANQQNQNWANMGFGWGTDLMKDQMTAGGMQQQQQQAMIDAIKKQMAGYTGYPDTAINRVSGNLPSPGGAGVTNTSNTPSVAGVLGQVASLF